MNRELFKEKMDYMLTTKGCDVLSLEEQLCLMNESIEALNNTNVTIKGANNIIIVIEELAELIKELTKALRIKKDITGILEELADVSICIDYIKEIFDITDKELEYARSIKLQELNNKLKSGTFM